VVIFTVCNYVFCLAIVITCR